MPVPSRLLHVTAGLAAAFALSGCNDYEPFLLAGYAQEDFSNDADILFVVDNSSSMQDEAEALAKNFDVFINQLTDQEAGRGTNGLEDAVGQYIGGLQNRSSFIDYQLMITTTDVENNSGKLYGTPQIIDRGDPNVAETFRKNLLCDATCFRAAQVPSDPSYTPGDPLGDIVSQEYLDNLCGTGGWQNHCGSGDEEGLEAVLEAMCRATDDPPDTCTDNTPLQTEGDFFTNEGMLRPDGTLISIIVTDEGDNSRRLPQGEGDPQEYRDAFSLFNNRMSFAVIGPSVERCNNGTATTWGIERYQAFVDDSNGRYFDIAEEVGGNCQVSDFATAMEELGALLNSLSDAFTLKGVPDTDTILVYVEGQEVERATVTTDDIGDETYSDGWSYAADSNSVKFHGTSVPDYNADVRIYYKPLSGMPRELPL